MAGNIGIEGEVRLEGFCFLSSCRKWGEGWRYEIENGLDIPNGIVDRNVVDYGRIRAQMLSR